MNKKNENDKKTIKLHIHRDKFGVLDSYIYDIRGDNKDMSITEVFTSTIHNAYNRLLEERKMRDEWQPKE